jgi:hypothetical protein
MEARRVETEGLDAAGTNSPVGEAETPNKEQDGTTRTGSDR